LPFDLSGLQGILPGALTRTARFRAGACHEHSLDKAAVSGAKKIKPLISIDIHETVERLRFHLKAITVGIGHRGLFSPDKLELTAAYIRSAYEEAGLPAEFEPYPCRSFTAKNVAAWCGPAGSPSKRYIVGAHYDCVLGTAGADDNASGVAVQLELARQVYALARMKRLEAGVKFVSFALEEYPAYGTPIMGSRVHARNARARNEQIDGMICLEMVGFSSHSHGSQRFPFPLTYMGYPKEGNFVGVAGNWNSRDLTRAVCASFQKHPALPSESATIPFNGWILPAVRLSDHASFWSFGYKAVMVTDTAFFRNPNYHLPSDTMETLDLEFMAGVVQGLLTFFESENGSGPDGRPTACRPR
jgi:hypothetical protein